MAIGRRETLCENSGLIKSEKSVFEEVNYDAEFLLNRLAVQVWAFDF